MLISVIRSMWSLIILICIFGLVYRPTFHLKTDDSTFEHLCFMFWSKLVWQRLLLLHQHTSCAAARWSRNVPSRKQWGPSLLYAEEVRSGAWQPCCEPGMLFPCLKITWLLTTSEHSNPRLSTERMYVYSSVFRILVWPCDDSLTHAKAGPSSFTAVSRATVWFPGECWQVPLPPPQPHRQQKSHCGGKSSERGAEASSSSGTSLPDRYLS